MRYILAACVVASFTLCSCLKPYTSDFNVVFGKATRNDSTFTLQNSVQQGTTANPYDLAGATVNQGTSVVLDVILKKKHRLTESQDLLIGDSAKVVLHIGSVVHTYQDTGQIIHAVLANSKLSFSFDSLTETTPKGKNLQKLSGQLTEP